MNISGHGQTESYWGISPDLDLVSAGAIESSQLGMNSGQTVSMMLYDDYDYDHGKDLSHCYHVSQMSILQSLMVNQLGRMHKEQLQDKPHQVRQQKQQLIH